MEIKRIGEMIEVDGQKANVNEVSLEVYDYGDDFFDIVFVKDGNLFGDSCLCGIPKNKINKRIKEFQVKSGLQHKVVEG